MSLYRKVPGPKSSFFTPEWLFAAVLFIWLPTSGTCETHPNSEGISSSKSHLLRSVIVTSPTLSNRIHSPAQSGDIPQTNQGSLHTLVLAQSGQKLAAGETVKEGEVSGVPGAFGKEAVDATKGIFPSDPNPDEGPKGSTAAYDFSTVAKPPDECKYGHQDSGIVIQMKAHHALNLFQSSPHTLISAFYQLANLEYVKRFADKDQPVAVLLGVPKDESILKSKRIILQPGMEDTLVMDRAEGAKYLLVVAGYYELDPAKCIRVYPIPTRTISTLFFGKAGCTAEKLAVKLQFGVKSIE